ncbi:fumarylacetoacetate hydrolase family protein [Jatrophihabitans telluris]|uniref:Fumarylacetoacetate hydrolase family protein n=1 Tax=Jatrophihabitans telluris TaxID=2038343 RepID=A0ABY4R2I2_9ACTN|nr:fumarylacetoacetate hydrolase family protein [Jatrophihabitans telluris]UQX89747.1 fumarylacetoacetate hydrolase family protein [Jatrophihabitans telluris]
MLLIRYTTQDEPTMPRVGIRTDTGAIMRLPVLTLGQLLRLPLPQLRAAVTQALTDAEREPGPVRVLPPVDGLTEVWASGVTYQRSNQARQEESVVADVYARVYDAPRPELFFKSVAWRVVGDGEPVGVRDDSAVDVPEPELALVLNADGELVGFTVCNDVSSRSIEGENPLYLPQAKVYAGSCALGPGIRPAWEIDGHDLTIEVDVTRGGTRVWSGATSTRLLHRRFDDLIEHLGRQLAFPEGVVLSSGTGLVPELDFSMSPEDTVRVSISEIGTLTNPVIAADPRSFRWLEQAARPVTAAGTLTSS